MIKEIHQAIKRPNKFQDASMQTNNKSGGLYFVSILSITYFP